MVIAAPAPTFEEIALADSVTAVAAMIDGAVDYWASAIERRATPRDLFADCVEWFSVICDQGRPSWTSPNEILWEAPVARLRDFSTTGFDSKVVPTLVLPPQAGHDSCIVDYSAEQSQMRAIVDAGLTRAFTLDWIGATERTKDCGIEEYLDEIDRAVHHLGGRVNLIGDCQGGWLATIYAALRPEHVNTLTIAGAPVDFHAGEPVIHAALKYLAPNGDLSFYRALVAAGGGVLHGEHMIAGFVAIKPDNEISRQIQLLAHIHEPHHVARYREFEDWFKQTQAIPGAFYLWIIEHLFRDNQLVGGNLEIRSERVELSRIACPLYLLAGATDHITPPPQVFALAEYASTPEADVMRDTTAGGHLGLFMSHEALRNHWPPLLRSVYERST